MNELRCPQCGAPVDAGAVECKYCGERIIFQQTAQPNPGPQPMNMNAQAGQPFAGGYQQNGPQQGGYQVPPQQGGYQIPPQQGAYQVPPQPQVYQVPPQGYQVPPQPMPNYYNNPAINPSWPVKSKITAGVLGILLGGIGVHKFYMGKIGMGILYLCFCWTYIPAIVGFIEGLIYLCSSDENFMLKHHVRIK